MAPTRILVNSIALGLFVTELNADYIKTERGKEVLSKLPIGRAARAEEKGGALLLLGFDAGRDHHRRWRRRDAIGLSWGWRQHTAIAARDRGKQI
jgi:hypothetical protein